MGAGRHARWGYVPTSVTRDVQALDFALEDETGRALVRMAEAETVHLVVEPGHPYPCEAAVSPSPELAALLERWPALAHGEALEPGLRFIETLLEPGAEVLVASEARREPDPTAADEGKDLRAIPERAVIVRTSAEPLLITDDRRYIYDRRPAPPVN